MGYALIYALGVFHGWLITYVVMRERAARQWRERAW